MSGVNGHIRHARCQDEDGACGQREVCGRTESGAPLRGAVRRRAVALASGDGTHRIETDDDRRPGVERELIADVTAAEELADERPLARRQADEEPLPTNVDGRHVVVVTDDSEATPKLVHRDVGPALDEAAELWRGAARSEAVAGPRWRGRRGRVRRRHDVAVGARLNAPTATVRGAVAGFFRSDGVVTHSVRRADRRRRSRPGEGCDRGRSRLDLPAWLGRLETGPSPGGLRRLAGRPMGSIAVMSTAHEARTPGAQADAMVTAADVRRVKVDDMCSAVLANRFGSV